jgi:aspartyl-tRNA(Asn)/glutamyl-tRNA(Gln) amidotransferase subunit A
LFRFTSIKDYHTALNAEHTTCIQAVKYYLDQITAHENLNAYLEVFSKEALEQAAILDAERKQGKKLGKLHGVIIGIKDVLSYKGHRLTAASKILENYTAVYTATAIQKLVDEGAIIMGRQNCDEFAMGSSNENSAYGPVKNAIDNSKVSGGSSGGSAVAVQAGLSMISIGSDTGGSVRQPADFCGVVGLKPSYGRISRYGLIAYASSFDQVGIFSKTIEDAALVLEVMAGEDEFDSTVSSKPVPAYSKLIARKEIENKLKESEEIEKGNNPKKIAYFKETLFHPGLDAEIKTKIESYLKDLTAKGYLVEAIDFSLFGLTINMKNYYYALPLFSKDFNVTNRKAKMIRMVIFAAGPINVNGIRYKTMMDRIEEQEYFVANWQNDLAV